MKKSRRKKPNRGQEKTGRALPPAMPSPTAAVVIPPRGVTTPVLTETARSFIGKTGKWIVTSIGFLAALPVLWDVIQQSNPTVQIYQISSVQDQLPFTITNPSHIFSMYNVTPNCDASSEIYVANDIHVFTAVIHGTIFNVPATETRQFPCSLPFLKGNSSPLDDISKIVWGGITVSFSYRTFLWPFERRTSDVCSGGKGLSRASIYGFQSTTKLCCGRRGGSKKVRERNKARNSPP